MFDAGKTIMIVLLCGEKKNYDGQTYGQNCYITIARQYADAR